MTDNLKPCPFCGSRKVEVGYDEDRNESMINQPMVTTFYIYCDECWAEGSHEDSKKEAIDNWNSRSCKCSDISKVETTDDFDYENYFDDVKDDLFEKINEIREDEENWYVLSKITETKDILKEMFIKIEELVEKTKCTTAK